MPSSSQKLNTNGPVPRVEIHYDVDLDGIKRTIHIPFVIGVIADLSGKPLEPLVPLAQREMFEINVDNFDDRLNLIKPRVAFTVPNTLTGEGSLSVDITFEKIADFSPAGLAHKVDPLRILLEMRRQLNNLLTYIDGKTGAEKLLSQLLSDPNLLKSLATASNPGPEIMPPE